MSALVYRSPKRTVRCRPISVIPIAGQYCRSWGYPFSERRLPISPAFSRFVKRCRGAKLTLHCGVGNGACLALNNVVAGQLATFAFYHRRTAIEPAAGKFVSHRFWEVYRVTSCDLPCLGRSHFLSTHGSCKSSLPLRLNSWRTCGRQICSSRKVGRLILYLIGT